MSPTPGASVLCSALHTVFVMAPNAAGAGLHHLGALPEAHQLLQCGLKST